MKAIYNYNFISLTIVFAIIAAHPTVVVGQSVVEQSIVSDHLSHYSDSLSHYLEIGAQQNPDVQSNFALYRASIEKMPQAGAYDDPELEIGFLLKPMETVGGKQIADIKLMQMFPWFGTKKAARTEALEMSRMAYERFRESRDNLWFNMKQKWYQLAYLNRQYQITQDVVELLRQLEQLATVRYSVGPNVGGTSSNRSIPVTSLPTSRNSQAMNGGMNMGSGSTSSSSSSEKSPSMPEKMPTSMGMSMGSSSENRLSDIFRIQMERLEVENQLKDIQSKQAIAEAEFNALLNRDQTAPIHLPSRLEPNLPKQLKEVSIDSVIARNPMLKMIDFEKRAYEAKAMMDRRMSFPMIGIGVQYSLRKASDMPIGMPSMNGKDMIMPMVKVSLPLFRKKYRSQERENKNYILSSELKKSNTLNGLETAYIRIQKQLEDAERNLELYANQYKLSEASWRLILREFSAGKQTLSDVLQVERQLLNYQLKQSEAIAQYNTLVAELEKLTSTF